MVQEAIHNWTKHVGENVFSDEVNRVFDDHKSEVEELVHKESNNWILVVKI